MKHLVLVLDVKYKVVPYGYGTKPSYSVDERAAMHFDIVKARRIGIEFPKKSYRAIYYTDTKGKYLVRFAISGKNKNNPTCLGLPDLILYKNRNNYWAEYFNNCFFTKEWDGMRVSRRIEYPE